MIKATRKTGGSPGPRAAGRGSTVRAPRLGMAKIPGIIAPPSRRQEAKSNPMAFAPLRERSRASALGATTARLARGGRRKPDAARARPPSPPGTVRRCGSSTHNRRDRPLPWCRDYRARASPRRAISALPSSSEPALRRRAARQVAVSRALAPSRRGPAVARRIDWNALDAIAGPLPRQGP